MSKSSPRHHKIVNPFTVVLVTLLFLLFTATFSSKSQTSNYVDDLSYLMPSENIFTLPVTINNTLHNIPVVKYTARQPIVKGVTIIIGDIQPNGNTDAKLHMLAKTLPDWGWNTLFVMPRLEYIIPSETENSAISELNEGELIEDVATINTEVTNDISETAETSLASTDDNETPPQVDIKPIDLQASYLPYSQEDYVKFIKNLTNTLSTTFQKGGGYQIIYAKGQSASATIELLLQQNDMTAHALVLNNPYWPNKELNQLLPKQLALLPMPVLDLISLSDNLWAKHTTNSRRVAAKIALKSLYRQQEVIGDQIRQDQHGQLSKEVVSWTYFLGW